VEENEELVFPSISFDEEPVSGEDEEDDMTDEEESW
jgi:hypothetical protein